MEKSNSEMEWNGKFHHVFPFFKLKPSLANLVKEYALFSQLDLLCSFATIMYTDPSVSRLQKVLKLSFCLPQFCGVILKLGPVQIICLKMCPQFHEAMEMMDPLKINE